MYHVINTPHCLENVEPSIRRLYVRGEINFKSYMVAIVGSRRATGEGGRNAYEIAYTLARHGIVVVSGLARGIDSQAHRGALEAGGKTIAVLPCGIKTVYPVSNIGLSRQIMRGGGALVSESGGSRLPRKEDFLARNRIISGLSLVTVVVEAARRSGALNTSAHALNAGREVMAVPGSINNPLSVGTNNLIKQGATPLTSVADVLEVLQLKFIQDSVDYQDASESPEERQVISLLSAGPMDFEKLSRKTQFSSRQLQIIVTEMEIKNKLKRLPGNYLKLTL